MTKGDLIKVLQDDPNPYDIEVMVKCDDYFWRIGQISLEIVTDIHETGQRFIGSYVIALD